MKKIKALLIILMAIITVSLTVTPTYAWSSDLYDDSQRETEYVLMDNTRYGFNVVFLVDDRIDFLDALGSGEFYITTYGSAGVPDQSIGGDANFWYYFEDMVMDFTTGVNAYMFIETTGNAAAALGVIDIQLIVIEDSVPPTYTYSQAEIDSPYNDLVTVQEIKSQLQATDAEDGDVTNRIQVYEDHYTSITPKVIGNEYFVMFMVDDIAGNAAYLRVDINVVDELKPVIVVTDLADQITQKADGSTINLTWYDDNYNNELDSYISQLAFDDDYYGFVEFESSTAVTAGWIFSRTGDWGSYDPYTPGSYTLNAVAQDPSGNTSTITFNVTVTDNQAPVISGSTSLDFEAVGFNVNDILSHYSATDAEDGSVAVTIKTHNISGNTLGAYSATLSAIDSFGKETTKIVTINLVDTIRPEIKIDGIDTVNYSHTVYMSDTTTLQSLINGTVVTDAYDGVITSNLVVPSFPTFSVPGTHNLELTASDSSGNVATLNLEVIVSDDIAPVINGATKIVKGLSETLTLSDILATLTVTDNVDNNLSLELVSDAYTGNSAVIGSYLVKYKTQDLSGNITYHSVRIWVVDNQAPAWILNDYFVNLGANEVMTRAELVSLLQSAGMIGTDISYTVTFVTDEYTGNESIEGAYSVVMNITYENGSEEQLAVELNVPEQVSDDVIVVTPEESLTGLQKLWNTIKNIVSTVWNVIKSVAQFLWNDIIKPVYEFLFVKDVDIVPTDDITTNITTQYQAPTTTTNPVQYL